MDLLFLDFETYYSDEYSLRKMTPPQYVADARFEALNCGFVRQGEQPYVIQGPDLPAHFATIDWPNTMAIAHNSLFDMMVMALRYGIIAGKYGDTMSMARNWLSHSTGGVSLGLVSKYYGLPEKWGTLNKTKGVTYAQLLQMPALHQEVDEYAIDDTTKCQTIFWNMMREGFPVGELDVIDMVIRMACQPQFEIDLELAHAHLGKVIADKEQLLERTGLTDRTNLMRDEPFAAMLMLAGADVPKKISKTTGKEAYAFAKTDKAFTELLEHENPEVQALVAARLGHKSTLEETRTARFIAIGSVMPRFPIPLKYSGAHTHRFSGDWSINAQNLPRGGQLRKALKAPKGKKVVSVDASQIEARLNSALSHQDDLTAQFRNGEDVYASFAEKIYLHPVNKVQFPTERFVGKTGILSLGYGSSWPVFQNMCRVQGNVVLSAADAAHIVDIYRSTYRQIVENWHYAGNTILNIMVGKFSMGEKNMWGPLEIKRNMIILPSGNRLHYRDLCQIYDDEKGQFKWMFKRGNIPSYIYGAKLVENVCQALAFVHLMEVAKRVCKMTNGLLPMAHQVHDELIYIVDAHLAEQVGRLVSTEMAKPPSWMTDAPFAAEFGIGDSYGDAK